MVYARGARKAKSKFLAASQMFTYGDYIIADGRQFLSMNQGTVIENFYPIRRDYTSLCYAQHVLEICEKTVPERTPCDDLLRLILKTLQHIAISAESGLNGAGRQAVHVFLFRFFLFYGLAPEMNSCCLCGEDINDSAALFCDEGMSCHICPKPDGISYVKARISLSLAAQEAIRHILSEDINSAFMFRVQSSVLDELERAARLCWLGHFPITLQTDIQ